MPWKDVSRDGGGKSFEEVEIRDEIYRGRREFSHEVVQFLLHEIELLRRDARNDNIYTHAIEDKKRELKELTDLCRNLGKKIIND